MRWLVFPPVVLLVGFWLVVMASAQEAQAPSATGKWLAEQDLQWQTTYRNEVAGVYGKALADLKKQYETSVEALLNAAAREGKLEEAVAFRAERDRAAAGEVSVDNDAAALPAIRSLRAAFAKSLATLTADRAARAKALYDRYEGVLVQNQTALTQRQRLDEALEIKAKREQLKTEWPEAIAGASVAPVTPPGPVPATPPTALALATPRPLGLVTAARPVEHVEFSICGSNGITLYINDKELIAGVRRDSVSKIRARLKEGDVLVVKNQDRWDINSTWIAASSTKGEFLFETSPKWISYAPADVAKWWIYKGAREQKPTTVAPDQQQYVTLVKKSVRESGLSREIQPIHGTVKFEAGRVNFLYYAVTREDLLPKADPK